MSTSRSPILWSLALLLCIDPAKLLAQSTTPQEPQCFSIRVRLNGKPIPSPKVITLKAKQTDSTATLEGGCFRVPPDLLTEKTLDVSFEVPRNKVYLSAITTGFFAGPWDIDLEDKKFGTDVAFPKHARAGEAWAFDIASRNTVHIGMTRNGEFLN